MTFSWKSIVKRRRSISILTMLFCFTSRKKRFPRLLFSNFDLLWQVCVLIFNVFHEIAPRIQRIRLFFSRNCVSHVYQERKNWVVDNKVSNSYMCIVMYVNLQTNNYVWQGSQSWVDCGCGYLMHDLYAFPCWRIWMYSGMIAGTKSRSGMGESHSKWYDVMELLVVGGRWKGRRDGGDWDGLGMCRKWNGWG